MNPSKATRAQLKQHNQQIILRAVYQGIADSRAALAQETGLAKPTVSDIISELMDAGLIEEGGRGNSTTSGGKRPRLLNFIPTARQVIGVSISPTEITGALAFLDGLPITQHSITIPEADAPPVITLVESAINALIVQCDEPLLCIGVGVPGIVNQVTGVVESSPLLNWYGVALQEYLQTLYEVPVHVSNNTELAARLHVAYDTHHETQNLVTVLANDSIEIGLSFDRTAYHHGGDLSTLTLSDGRKINALTWQTIKRRAADLLAQHPDSQLHQHKFTYVALGYAAVQGDAVAGQLVDEISAGLAEIYGWIIALMRPDEITLAGSMSDMGDVLLTGLQHRLEQTLPERVVQLTRLTLARSRNLSVLGAVAHAIQQELGIL